jgi:hypothetical protein
MQRERAAKNFQRAMAGEQAHYRSVEDMNEIIATGGCKIGVLPD